MSAEATLTGKGQTTIPKPIRDSLDMKVATVVSFTLMTDGVWFCWKPNGCCEADMTWRRRVWLRVPGFVE